MKIKPDFLQLYYYHNQLILDSWKWNQTQILHWFFHNVSARSYVLYSFVLLGCSCCLRQCTPIDTLSQAVVLIRGVLIGCGPVSVTVSWVWVVCWCVAFVFRQNYFPRSWDIVCIISFINGWQVRPYRNIVIEPMTNTWTTGIPFYHLTPSVKD